MLQGLNELLGTPLLRQVGRLLQLVVFLLEPIVELGKFNLHVVLDIFLLVADDLKDLVFELLLALDLQLLQLIKH